jgi:hypothetical protein
MIRGTRCFDSLRLSLRSFLSGLHIGMAEEFVVVCDKADSKTVVSALEELRESVSAFDGPSMFLPMCCARSLLGGRCRNMSFRRIGKLHAGILMKRVQYPGNDPVARGDEFPVM